MTTIRATDPAQFLTLVPHLLGYTPTRSLVPAESDADACSGGASVLAQRRSAPP